MSSQLSSGYQLPLPEGVGRESITLQNSCRSLVSSLTYLIQIFFYAETTEELLYHSTRGSGTCSDKRKRYLFLAVHPLKVVAFPTVLTQQLALIISSANYLGDLLEELSQLHHVISGLEDVGKHTPLSSIWSG